MNIGDVKGITIKGDKLEAIFKRQWELEKKYRKIEEKRGALTPPIPLDIDTFEGQERVRLIIYRITEELFEAGNCLRNKAWKVSQVPTDKNHFVEELSDAFHFVIQLCIELGISSNQLCQLYFKKSEVNRFRQRSKY